MKCKPAMSPLCCVNGCKNVKHTADVDLYLQLICECVRKATNVAYFVDDIVLFAPSANTTKNTLNGSLCDNFGERYSVVFNASKSKCLFF